jgi:hypothetical protein
MPHPNRITILMEGGLIQDIKADAPIDVRLLDRDLFEGSNPDDLEHAATSDHQYSLTIAPVEEQEQDRQEFIEEAQGHLKALEDITIKSS